MPVRLLAVALLFAMALPAAARPRGGAPLACSDGRFLVPHGAVLVAGGPAPDALQIEAGSGAVDSGCAPTTLRTERHGRGFSARWRDCQGRRARLQARFVKGCDTVAVRWRRASRRAKRYISPARAASMIVYGFPLAADLLESRDPALAGRMRDLVGSQTAALPPVQLEVLLPSGPRGGAPLAATVAGAPAAHVVDGDVVRFAVPPQSGLPVAWRVAGVP